MTDYESAHDPQCNYYKKVNWDFTVISFNNIVMSFTPKELLFFPQRV